MSTLVKICLSAGLAITFSASASVAWTPPTEPTGAEPKRVEGILLDGDRPALYRLPPVPSDRNTARIAALPKPASVRTTECQSQFEGSRLDSTSIHTPPAADFTPITAEPLSTFPYAPNTQQLSAQLLPAVQRGYGLAQRGAIAAAEAEFIQVLRRIAEAKDIQRGTDEHSRALAAGLRALDEAEDFVPDGVQLEAELDVRIVASSHRTPLLGHQPTKVLPHDAIARYHRYAQAQLTTAVAHEQSGSMVLHGLGKVHARLAERDNDLRASRIAMTLFFAALATCPLNHLAANELGVLFCRNGHAAEAAAMFERTIDLMPSATAYHNLAVAQQKLGMHGQAAANERESQRLAALERAGGEFARRAGIQWVSPAQMSGVPQVPMAYGGAAARNRGAAELSGRGHLPRSRWR